MAQWQWHPREEKRERERERERKRQSEMFVSLTIVQLWVCALCHFMDTECLVVVCPLPLFVRLMQWPDRDVIWMNGHWWRKSPLQVATGEESEGQIKLYQWSVWLCLVDFSRVQDTTSLSHKHRAVCTNWWWSNWNNSRVTPAMTKWFKQQLPLCVPIDFFSIVCPLFLSLCLSSLPFCLSFTSYICLPIDRLLLPFCLLLFSPFALFLFCFRFNNWQLITCQIGLSHLQSWVSTTALFPR